MVTVLIEKTGKTEEVEHSGTARELCSVVGVNVEEVIIVQDGILITEEDEISGKKVELLSVISGG